MSRKVLPARRYAETFEIQAVDERWPYQVTVGVDPETHSVAEVFISGSKVGSLAEGIARDFAVVLSIALQHGVPLDIIQHSITRLQDGAPQSIAGRVLDRLAELQDAIRGSRPAAPPPRR